MQDAAQEADSLLWNTVMKMQSLQAIDHMAISFEQGPRHIKGLVASSLAIARKCTSLI